MGDDMSTRYRRSNEVPTKILCDRLTVLSDAVTKGNKSVSREFTMSIPAEHDRDADLVLAESARRLKIFEKVYVLAVKHCPSTHHDYKFLMDAMETV